MVSNSIFNHKIKPNCFQEIDEDLKLFYIPPPLEVAPLHSTNSIHIRGAQKELLKKKKIILEKKFFTKEDDCLLKCRVKHVTKKFGVTNLLAMLGLYQGIIEKNKKYNKKTRIHFLQHVAKGFNNCTLESILHRLRLLYHPYRDNSQFTHKDDKKLKKMVQKSSLTDGYVNWLNISLVLKKPVKACRKRWGFLLEYKKGRWSVEESEKLERILVKVLNGNDPYLVSSKQICWEKVQRKMKSRSAIQCLTHWNRVMCKARLTKLGILDIVSKILKSKAEKSTDVNWEKLVKKFNLNCSPMYLSDRIYKLINRNLHLGFTFKEALQSLIDELKNCETEVCLARIKVEKNEHQKLSIENKFEDN